ncbi:hypothetical protein TSTA_016440 [Talaromyces stipitatus ATCC 10500]|uniref:Zn(2)-C6 fungal-type domain-containing protein n=1 Tax=Talaromyces stipitatus (strain ATCC 10500 / CBS 375.48 / QM 6759 / NRRL 1006) TaxID=441959 RepID=B8MED9_TALSN|nr:uncharacterized protein TSTA_016440 [Talaromyces stipitatus ATCC 10500]EED16566.1 hypothetical protein TSTA_016440 [Talaromyces stipitatus ATCC 10500]
MTVNTRKRTERDFGSNQAESSARKRSKRDNSTEESHDTTQYEQDEKWPYIDSDGDYELDPDYVSPHRNNTIAGYQALQPIGHSVDEQAEDGDNEDNADDASSDDGDYKDEPYEDEVDDNDEMGPLDEEVEEWKKAEVKKIVNNINSTEKRIRYLKTRKSNAEKRANDKAEEYTREWNARNKGRSELDKIEAAKRAAQDQVQNAEDDLMKARDRLANHQARKAAVEQNARQEYMEAVRTRRVRIPRTRKEERHYDPGDLDDGDDSLSDQIADQLAIETRKKRQKKKEHGKGKQRAIKDDSEEGENEGPKHNPKKDYARACRRCRLKKKRCVMNPENTACANCIQDAKRCRLTDHVTGKQIHVNELQETQVKLDSALNELARFRAMSKISIGLDNPLAGITGYGPPTQKRAMQNWARMNRGLEPLSPLSAQASGSGGTPGKRKSPTDGNDSESSQAVKRQKTVPPQPKNFSFQNQTQESYPTSRRRRRPGATLRRANVQTQQKTKREEAAEKLFQEAQQQRLLYLQAQQAEPQQEKVEQQQKATR